MLIGICGGGVGGLAAGIALRGAGHDIEIFEQATSFRRVGSDVNLTPNGVRALQGLGVVPTLLETAARPTHRISRTWDTGEETSRLEMAASAERLYGSPQLTIHRADLLDALQRHLPSDVVRLGCQIAKIELGEHSATVGFADGRHRTVDVLIGADGIHSLTRAALFGPEYPQFTGLTSYRSVFNSSLVSVPNMGAFTKWWGPSPDLQIVTFPLNKGRETFVFATTAQPEWRHESWTMPGDIEELRTAYAAFHPEARALLETCTEVTKSALYVREPLGAWSKGSATLLGDACHPMTPFMAQGATMALEDAVVLGRALEGAVASDVAHRLGLYEGIRKERTARIQLGSRGNEWLKEDGNADWVYAYDAWSVPLEF